MPRLPIALAFALLLPACGPEVGKLDEAPLHTGPVYRIKVVRYHENLPFHYTGEVFRVLCASPRTAGSPAHRTQEAGWVTIGNGGAIGSKSAAEIAARERQRYLAIDDETLAWIGFRVSVSFDACGSFRGWDPTQLPAELVDPAPRPDWCRPKGTADCRQHDFLGEREPRYEDVRASPDGRISFVVRSKALKPGIAVAVASGDGGRTWTTRVTDEGGRR